MALAAVGVFFVFSFFLLFLGCFVGLITFSIKAHKVNFGIIKLLIFLGIPLFLMIKSSFIKIPEPYGISIKKEDYPELFNLIENIKTNLKTPKIHKVHIDFTFNASIQQIPTLGLFGMSKTYLVIGLPLIYCLSKDQLASVIAHELGHISKKHGFITSQIYILKQSWDKIIYSLEKENHISSIIFIKFFERFLPFFNSYSFIMMRQHEYEADKLAAEYAGVKNAGDAFLYAKIYSYIHNEYQDNLWKRAETEKNSPQSPVSDLFKEFQKPISNNIISNIIYSALQEEITYEDEHPSISKRLQAIGYNPNNQFTFLPGQSSIELLGKKAQILIDKLDKYWIDCYKYLWEDTFYTTLNHKKHLENIEKQNSSGEYLTLEKCLLYLELKDTNNAHKCFKKLLEKNPNDSAANFEYGVFLLDNKDKSGIKYLEKAYEKNYNFKLPALEFIYDYYKSINYQEKADEYYDLYNEFIDIAEKAQLERANVYNAKLTNHDLSTQEVRHFISHLKKYNDVEEAFLIKLHPKLFPEYPCYYLCIKLKASFMNYLIDSMTGKLDKYQEKCAQIIKEFSYIDKINDYELYYVALNTYNLGRKLKKLKNSKIYENKNAKPSK